MREYRYLMKEIHNINKKCIPVQFLYGIFTAFYATVSLYFPKWIIGEIVGEARYRVVLLLIVIMVTVTMTVKFLTIVIETFSSDNHLRNIYELTLRVKAHNAEIAYEDTQNAEIQEMFEKACVAAKKLPRMASDINVGLVCSVLRIIITMFFLSNVNFACVALLLASTLADYFIKIKMKERSYEYNSLKTAAKRSLKYYDGLSFDPDAGEQIRLFHMKGHIKEKYTAKIKELVWYERQRLKVISNQQIVSSEIGVLQQVCVYVFLIGASFANQVSIADFVIAIPMITAFVRAVNDITDQLAELRGMKRYIHDYTEWLHVESNKGGINIADIKSIRFCDVSFKYPGSESFALEHVSVLIEDKKNVMLVGENGSGKSTFVKLMLGMYMPTDGDIYINGINMKSINKHSLWEQSAVVFQDFRLLNYSIKDNLCFGRNIEDSKIRMVLERVGLASAVYDNRYGIHTFAMNQLDDKGKGFSGGEQQKLAVARAFIHGGSLYVMDEPTSACDPISEALLFEDYMKETADTTAVFVSHRLSAAKNCDMIYVFEKGKIIERGSHEMLMQMKGVYNDLYWKQASMYAHGGQ